MASAAFTADTRVVKRLAAALKGTALEAADRRRLTRALGVELEDQTKERFDSKVSPEGDPWKAISDAHQEFLARRFPGAEPPLVVSGGLRDAVESQSGEWAVLTGATKIYAAVHQLGWDEKNIPARPYLGIGDRDEEGLAGIVEDFLEARLRRAS